MAHAAPHLRRLESIGFAIGKIADTRSESVIFNKKDQANQ
jgi:hypothetical protein